METVISWATFLFPPGTVFEFNKHQQGEIIPVSELCDGAMCLRRSIFAMYLSIQQYLVIYQYLPICTPGIYNIPSTTVSQGYLICIRIQATKKKTTYSHPKHCFGVCLKVSKLLLIIISFLFFPLLILVSPPCFSSLFTPPHLLSIHTELLLNLLLR